LIGELSKCAAAIRHIALVEVDSPIGEVFVVAQQVNSIPEKRKAALLIFPYTILLKKKLLISNPILLAAVFVSSTQTFFGSS
jgi:hypothetical protein